ncbi:hypothetical protein GCM10010232_26250 [Streptomyces amakusaensis]|uniref:Uncharacterized protein n=2 Tax=Streptomyces TaxID=1883 RepID=A0A918PLW2_9ACTN|nr:hypothetical protein [Streptomyces inusitatus]GGZ15605.1 hypothetical protein GCM10010387_05010 [Streptomyces inusitatus]
MAVHATMPARHHGSLGWAIPVALGTLFGFYAGFLRRTGEAVSWWDVLYGVVAGLIFTALAFGLGRIQHALPQELRAAAYAALCGVAIGFLHSLTGTSILRSVGMGLFFAAAMLVVSFYVFHTREE